MKKITLFTILFMGFAHATETRVNVITQNSARPGYANFLLDDEYIIQLYPSALSKFPTHFSIETPFIGNNIYGNYAYASVFGKYSNLGFGAYAGRDRIVDDTIGFQLTPIDLVGSFDIQNIALGLNLRVGRFSAETLRIRLTDTAKITIGASVIGFNPSVSFNISERTGLNIGIPIQFVFGKRKTKDTVNVDYSSNNFRFFGRFYSVPFIAYALFEIDRESWNNPATNANPDSIESGLLFGAGGGINLPISEIGFGIVGLSFTSFSGTITRNNRETNQSVFLISLLLGGEIKVIRDNIKLRSSFTYDFIANVNDPTIQPPKFSQIGRAGNLALGIGYEIGFIRLDASLSTDLLYDGPFFLTGNQSNFIQSLSILGKF